MTKPTTRKPGSKTPAALPPAPPAIQTIGEFLIQGLICRVIRVHEPSDRKLDTGTMYSRGNAVSADMGMTDGQFLFNHCREIPSDFSHLSFVFPSWTSSDDDDKDDGFVRVLNMKGVSWWCAVKYPDLSDWDSNCVLVRFVPLATVVKV